MGVTLYLQNRKINKDLEDTREELDRQRMRPQGPPGIPGMSPGGPAGADDATHSMVSTPSRWCVTEGDGAFQRDFCF